MTTSRIAQPANPRPSFSAQPASGRSYFPALDGIRALAFLMVFGTHYLQLSWGWAGVNIFFVLSGFLITGILYDTRDQPHRIWNFYLRRTLRIFPLYYGVILLLVLLYPIFRWQWSWHWLIWPAYLGNMLRAVPPHGSALALLEFAQPLSRTFPGIQLSLGHCWSLCVEEQFYLLWPWVIFGVASRRRLMHICAMGIVVLPLLRVLANHALPHNVINNAALITVTPFPFDALLLGAILALVRRGPRAAMVLPAARITLAGIAIAVAVLLAFSSSARSTALPALYADHPRGTFTWGISVINIIAACLIVLALNRGSLTFRLFDLQPLRWLGRISYGAYVFHDILHPQFYRVANHFANHYPAHTRLVTAALGFVVTLLVAWASFRWFESPFIHLKDRWTRTVPAPCKQIPQTSVPELIQHVA